MLRSDKTHAIPADIGKPVKPMPVFDTVKEVEFVPVKTIVYTDSNKVCRVL